MLVQYKMDSLTNVTQAAGMSDLDRVFEQFLEQKLAVIRSVVCVLLGFY